MTDRCSDSVRHGPLVAAAFGVAIVLGACGDDHAGHVHDSATATATATAHSHAHQAPHGGTLVVLGEEFAHIEVKVDSKTGALTAWVLDGECESAVRIAQTSVTIRVGDGATAVDVALGAVANALTGESVGDTSQFDGVSPRIVGLDRFAGTVLSVNVKGQRFENVTFRYPEGNE